MASQTPTSKRQYCTPLSHQQEKIAVHVVKLCDI